MTKNNPMAQKQLQQKRKDLGLLVASYQNHILYSSVYIALCSHLWNQLQQQNDLLTNISIQVGMLAIGFALTVYLLTLEVSFMIKRLRLPPGDSGLPILGHLPALIRNSEAHFVQQFERYGPLCTICSFYFPIALVTNDDDVHWAMTLERKGLTKAFVLPHLQRLLGEEAIMMKSGDTHKQLRKIFEPAFTPLAIRDYASTIDTITQEQLAQWCASGEWQTPREWALLAMRIFFVCAFGEANEERMDRLTFLFENWTAGFNAMIPFEIPGTMYHRAHGYKRKLGKEMLNMIEEFKAKNSPESEAGKKSVMGRLCYSKDEHGNGPSEQELLDNLRFFLVAGFDTTKASFGALAQFVKRNPQLESVLFDEVKNLKEPLDIDQLKKEAPVLNAVLAETWRLASPLSSHSAITTEDLHYKGYVFPKGTVIAADMQAHNVTNDDLYPDAANFHFERWLPKDHSLYNPELANREEIDYNVMNSKYRPFNMGAHMCLGGHFAKLEVRIVVARLFQKYTLEISNERVKRFPVKQILSDFKLKERKL